MSDRRTIACVTMAARARRKANEYTMRQGSSAKPDVVAMGLLEAIYWATLANLAAAPSPDLGVLEAVDAAISESRS